VSISATKAQDVAQHFEELPLVASEMEQRHEEGLSPEEADANRQDAIYIREVALGNASDIKRGVVSERLERVGSGLVGLGGPAGILGGLVLLGATAVAWLGRKKKPKRGIVSNSGGNDGSG